LFIQNGILLAIICQLQGGKQTGPQNGDYQPNQCQFAALGSSLLSLLIYNFKYYFSK